MTKEQALALLSLLADLYRIANQPDQPQAVVRNLEDSPKESPHKVKVAEG